MLFKSKFFSINCNEGEKIQTLLTSCKSLFVLCLFSRVSRSIGSPLRGGTLHPYERCILTVCTLSLGVSDQPGGQLSGLFRLRCHQVSPNAAGVKTPPSPVQVRRHAGKTHKNSPSHSQNSQIHILTFRLPIHTHPSSHSDSPIHKFTTTHAHHKFTHSHQCKGTTLSPGPNKVPCSKTPQYLISFKRLTFTMILFMLLNHYLCLPLLSLCSH